MTPGEIHDEMRRLSQSLDKALTSLYEAGREWAQAENDYRMARAVAYLNSDGTVEARKSTTDLATSDERQRAHLADAMRQAALEAVRSRRTQLSALQTVVNALKAETELVTYGPQ